MSNGSVVLITGASSGIGYQTAALMAEKGYVVYGAARRVEKIAALADVGVNALPLDITDETSILHLVQAVIEKEGRIDLLINNAGYGSYGAIENVPISEAKRQFEVNLFGLAKLVQLVLPYMRHQGAGRILNVSSMAGRVTTYFGAWYHATKYALEAFSDALRMETAPYGIDVVLIEPGGIKTDWGLIAADHLSTTSKGTVYEKEANATAARMKKMYTSVQLTDPAVIAQTIMKASESHRPKTRYLVGYGAKVAVFFHEILPDRAFDKVIKRFI